MIPITLAEVAAAVGGQPADAPDPAVVRVSGPVVVDSRRARAGSLFVAVKGERVDGHEHAADAVAAGAVAALVERPVGVPAVVVDDTVRALGRLARAVVDRLDATVVGLTGSSGKTSTKDLLAQVLEHAGPTVAPEGSFNTEIGLPLTALAADLSTRHLVLEMGARGPGHISYLCEVAPPRIGVVLNVGLAHAGEFGGREATAAAKQELVQALPPGAHSGVAVLNADDSLVKGMAAATSARVVMFGRAPEADVRADAVSLDEHGRASFLLVTPEGSAEVRLRVHGAHHVGNALAAAAVARELGMGVVAVAGALSAATPRSRWRMEVADRPDGVTVVNDAYNANPDSMRAALEALAAMAAMAGSGEGRASRSRRPRRPRRSWAVLGEMLELGAGSAAEHEQVGRLAVRLGVTRVVAVGGGASPVVAGARDELASRTAAGEGEPGGPAPGGLAPGGLAPGDGGELGEVADAESALALLRRELLPGDIVLVKASRAAGLERVAAGLLEPDPSQPHPDPDPDLGHPDPEHPDPVQPHPDPHPGHPDPSHPHPVQPHPDPHPGHPDPSHPQAPEGRA